MSLRLALLLAITAFCLSGCACYRYTFPITLVVKTTNGQPIEGARVSDWPDLGSPESGMRTDADGVCTWVLNEVQERVKVQGGPAWTKWVGGEGYLTQEVVIRPDRVPESYKEPVPIHVEVRLIRLADGTVGEAVRAAEAVIVAMTRH